MNFPVWELEMGGGLLIAIVAVFHVYISHFAIGGGFFLVITEHAAYKNDDQGLIKYLKMHSRFFALVTLVLGALSGVGIWFTIGLVSPAATSALIRTFVWAWAIEWVFFFVEIAAALFYFMTWERVTRKIHLAIGWIYFAAAFLSLVAINGIITFMLTPGEWLNTRDFWDGFLNPTYWPSLIARTAICIALAGIYALLTGQFVKKKTKKEWLIRYAGIWSLAGTLLAAPAMWWYYKLLPEGSSDLIAGVIPATSVTVTFLGWSSLALIILLLFPVILPKKFSLNFAVFIALVGLVTFGASERIRETLRKPYIIYGYMYGNSLKPEEYEIIRENGGILAGAQWIRNREQREDSLAGREVFRVACRGCHTVDGYMGLSSPMSGLDEEFIYGLVRRLEYLRGKMPPFPGTETEARAVAAFLFNQSEPTELTTGENVYEKRCGFCHSVDGALRPMNLIMEGLTDEDIGEILPFLGDLVEGMPGWTGSDEEAELLIGYIRSWYTTDEDETEGGR
ncbi:c-type cytochrome [candidate division KSB1 bacterium]